MTSKLDRSVPVTLLAGAEPAPGPEGAAAMVGTAIEVMGRQPSEVAVVAPWGWAEAAHAAGVQRVVEVDAEVRYLTDGCACCTVRADLYGPMATLTRDRDVRSRSWSSTPPAPRRWRPGPSSSPRATAAAAACTAPCSRCPGRRPRPAWWMARRPALSPTRACSWLTPS